MKFYITGSLFFSIVNFVILRVLGDFVVQMLFLTALFGINDSVDLMQFNFYLGGAITGGKKKSVILQLGFCKITKIFIIPNAAKQSEESVYPRNIVD